MKTIARFPGNALAAVLLVIGMSSGAITIHAESQDQPAPRTHRGSGYGPGLDYGDGMMGGYGPVGGFGTDMMVYGPNWRSYRDYTFNANSDEILRSDGHKAREVASYVDHNPSLRVGLDGSSESNVLAVRHALIMAGVPASKIETGAYGDPQLRRDGRVAVLVSK